MRNTCGLILPKIGTDLRAWPDSRGGWRGLSRPADDMGFSIRPRVLNHPFSKPLVAER